MRIKFVISLRSSFSFRREWWWKLQFTECGNERSPWSEDASRMTRRNELTGSFPIPFWLDSSLLLRLPANAICVAVFYRVTMPNVQCRFLRSIKKQKRQGRWRGKLSRLSSARSRAIPPFDVATFEKVAHLLLSHWPPGFYSARLHVHSILEKEWNRGALVNGRDTEVLPCSRKSKRGRDSSESRASTRA